ncbi:MAG: L,D-transpeptidase family protein [Betaproteobacteria bacterium]|nr:L,D-transpeptidase family protein [Betaproteobacteria bacterium]
MRWVAQNLKGDYLVVDIAGFHAQLTLGGRVAWSSRVVVGRPYRKTPVFRAALRTIVLNPSWNVPPTILEEDVVPKLVKDPGFLARNHMRVLDFAGHAVDPATIDWARYVGRKLPYQIVQAAGDDNPLGRLKFLFPNPHDVYLHDTPAKALFEEPERAFSSSCIRVEHPLELALLLLDDPERWNAETLRAAIAIGETRTIPVKRRVPVMLLYWTAQARADGTVEFHPDLYARDAQVLKGLEAPFRFSLPRRAPDDKRHT